METQVKETTHKAEGEEAIHLSVGAKRSGDSVISIRWCICKAVFDELKERQVKEPYLLLVVVVHDKKREVVRKLVPLQRMMEYIYFQGPGSHKIFATIVWPEGNVERLKEFFLEKVSYKAYENEVLHYNGNLRDFNRDTWGIGQIGQATLKIEVAKEFFAKEPPQWLSRWVNLWFETRPQDECQFRRRCMLAFSIQPPVMLVYLMFISLTRFLIAGILLLWGMREIDFQPLIHPFGCSTGDIWMDCFRWGRGSVFLRDKQGRRRSSLLIPLIPIVILGLFGGMYLLNYFASFGMSIWLLLGIVVGAVFLEYIIILIGKILLSLGKECSVSIKERMDEVEKREAKRRAKRELWKLEKKYAKKISALVCTGEPLKAKIEALPRTNRTIYLRFMDLKARVCKPFARY